MTLLAAITSPAAATHAVVLTPGAPPPAATATAALPAPIDPSEWALAGLQFVLPVQDSSFRSLETLHIIHCGDLSHVFILDETYYTEITTHGVQFPKLTTILLHDLPKLQNICEVKMVAPALKSIKIRGCWSLRRLPSVGARGRRKKKPSVEIEKDVWDSLEWDAGHRPDHFKAPVHSRYYKEKLPRVSVLR